MCPLQNSCDNVKEACISIQWANFTFVFLYSIIMAAVVSLGRP